MKLRQIILMHQILEHNYDYTVNTSTSYLVMTTLNLTLLVDLIFLKNYFLESTLPQQNLLQMLASQVSLYTLSILYQIVLALEYEERYLAKQMVELGLYTLERYQVLQKMRTILPLQLLGVTRKEISS